MQVKKIKSIFELFIKQNIEFKFVLFLIVQTLLRFDDPGDDPDSLLIMLRS